MTKINRPIFHENKIVFSDGLVGGGKALLAQVVSSLPKVEMWLHNPKIENICGAYYLDTIELNTAKHLIRNWIDEDIDNISMLRNSNFRFSDHSSIFKYPRRFEYLKRLFLKSENELLKKFIREKRIMHFMTHSISGHSDPIFHALNSQLLFLRITRCPMTFYMLGHVAKWSERWGNDMRSGTLLIKKQNTNIPYFMLEKSEKYINSSPYERAIYIIEEWQTSGNKKIDQLKLHSKANILEIPFEKFVFNPKPYICKICEILDVKMDNLTFKEMKKQKVPRKSLSDAPYNKVYKKIGWVKPKDHLSVKAEIDFSRNKISKLVSYEALNILDKITYDYIDRYKIL